MKGVNFSFRTSFTAFLCLILFSFVSAQNIQNTRGMVKIIPPIPSLSNLDIGYSESWALVIGIDNYLSYPHLRTAVSGAKAFAQKLKKEFGFKPDHVIELYNEQATKKRIEAILKDSLFKSLGKNDRLIIYYGGHGDTFNGQIGYICPYDANKERLPFTGISMNDINELNKIFVAKHIWYIFDCCFSGLAAVRGSISDLPPTEKDYYKKLLTKKTRQILTAGQSDELASDVGPDSTSSPFTYFLLEALESSQVRDNYGVLQASKIGQYVKEKVSRYTGAKQSPLIDRFPESENGDMLLWKPIDHPILLKPIDLQRANGNQTPLDLLIKVKNKNYGKKNYIIIFWDSYCVPCKYEIKTMNKMPIPPDFQIITINLDNPDQPLDFTRAKNFISQFENDKFINLFLISNDQKTEILQNLQFSGTPLTILVDKDLNIRYYKKGFDYNVPQAAMLLFSDLISARIH